MDTTCGDVMSVWKRVRQYAKESSPASSTANRRHEETKATSSQAMASAADIIWWCSPSPRRITFATTSCNGGDKAEFLAKFAGAYSEGFDPDLHLEAIGVANQTTMLRGETEEMQRRLRRAMVQKYGEADIRPHFRFFDTICGATQERQDALEKLLQEPLDLLLVIGGYNSSNTSHLAEMGEAKLPTFFIKNAAKMARTSRSATTTCTSRRKSRRAELAARGQVTVGITAGASCPNNLIEDASPAVRAARISRLQQLIES